MPFFVLTSFGIMYLKEVYTKLCFLQLPNKTMRGKQCVPFFLVTKTQELFFSFHYC